MAAGRPVAARSPAGRPDATLADVAALAGVSLATASRALHSTGGRTVRAEAAERVRAAAVTLRYVPNAAARATARGRTDTVALIVHDIADPFTAALTGAVMSAALADDLIVTIAATAGDPEIELRHLEQFRRQRARAVILAGSRFTDADSGPLLAAEIDAFTTGGGQVVVIGSPGQGLEHVPTVPIDEQDGAARLGAVLCTLGYRTFAVLAGPENLVSSEQRLAGFRRGVAGHGGIVPDEWVLSVQWSRDGGYVGMRELLDQGLDIAEVDAVFAVNDVMAIGAMAALAEHGYRVPEDVALAGFEDVPMLRDIRPSLTTVTLPAVEIARTATRRALHEAPHPDTTRESTAGDAGRAESPRERPEFPNPSAAVRLEVVVRSSTPDRRPSSGGR